MCTIRSESKNIHQQYNKRSREIGLRGKKPLSVFKLKNQYIWEDSRNIQEDKRKKEFTSIMNKNRGIHV